MLSVDSKNDNADDTAEGDSFAVTKTKTKTKTPSGVSTEGSQLTAHSQELTANSQEPDTTQEFSHADLADFTEGCIARNARSCRLSRVYASGGTYKR